MCILIKLKCWYKKQFINSSILPLNKSDPVVCVLFFGAFLYYSSEYGVVGWGPRGEMGQGGEILRTSSKISAFAQNGNFTGNMAFSYFIFVTFFYTTTIWGLKILHLKVCKCATRVASRQNSVNKLTYLFYVWNIYTVLCVNYTLCVKSYTVCKSTLCV